MRNRKIAVDRPSVSANEIQAGMNFNQLMVAYGGVSKPFYKTKWFFGTTGIASIGLVVGGAILFQEDKPLELNSMAEPAGIPPEPKNNLAEAELLALNAPDESTLQVNLIDHTTSQEIVTNKQQKHDKIITPSVPEENLELSNEVEKSDVGMKLDDKQADQVAFDPMDMTPRINGKMNGSITREELLDNKGLTTNADINIIHFEMHLIDGLGGKVFEEESNQLNQQMKAALAGVGQGETIYFENIKGKTSDGHIVRLNPLRYVLLN